MGIHNRVLDEPVWDTSDVTVLFLFSILNTGSPSITVRSQPHLKLPSDGPLVLEAEFSGVYYNHTWVYRSSDPNATDATNLIGADGVEEDLLNGRLVVDPSSPSLQVGYYIPRIYIDEEGTILEDGNIFVFSKYLHS